MAVLNAKIGGAWVPISFTSPPEVHIGSTTPPGPQTIWIDTTTTPPTTRAWVSGAWVTVGAIAPNEVFVGTADPLPADTNVELWYDTDAPAPPAPSTLFQIYPTKAAMDAVTGENGSLASVVENNRLYQRIGGAWVITGGSMPRVDVGRSGGSFANGSSTLNWTIENADTDNLYDPATPTRIMTCPAGMAGRWNIQGTMSWDVNSVGTRAHWYERNASGVRIGMAESSAQGATAGGISTTSSRDVILAVGDYLSLTVFQSSGGSLNVGNTTNVQVRYQGPS